MASKIVQACFSLLIENRQWFDSGSPQVQNPKCFFVALLLTLHSSLLTLYSLRQDYPRNFLIFLNNSVSSIGLGR